jgi:hypothetical protein
MEPPLETMKTEPEPPAPPKTGVAAAGAGVSSEARAAQLAAGGPAEGANAEVEELRTQVRLLMHAEAKRQQRKARN